MRDGKVCSGCGNWKVLDLFPRVRSAHDGRHSKCKECRSAYNREHYAKNREHYSEVRRRWYEEHRDEHRERVLSKRDPRVHAERARRWGQSPEGKLKKRENSALRRAKGAYRDTTRMGRFFKDVLERDGMVCHICGGEIASMDDLHFDHVVPVSKGGLHVLDNVRPAHALCNRQKAARIERAA